MILRKIGRNKKHQKVIMLDIRKKN